MQIVDDRYKVSPTDDQNSDYYVPDTQLSQVSNENIDKFFPVIQESQEENQVKILLCCTFM